MLALFLPSTNILHRVLWLCKVSACTMVGLVAVIGVLLSLPMPLRHLIGSLPD